ncbi:hypothetical protein T190607A02C_90008 [Tenacibaculum sp. 190524A02b]
MGEGKLVLFQINNQILNETIYEKIKETNCSYACVINKFIFYFLF